ncbi:hypothetical protein ACXHXG_20435 [Rhizobium sp. LEGMi198b]
MVKSVEFEGLIADKAFDSDAIINDLNKRAAKIVISQHSRRSKPLPLDHKLYKWRHLIENFFCKLKSFKRIANGRKLHRNHPSRRSRHQFKMNPHTP